jgi:hypothetical protein
MSRRRSLLVAAAVVAWLAALAGLYFFLTEPFEKEVVRGPRGAALRDPLLAARRLITALGVPAEAGHRVVPVPDPSAALLLVAPPGTVSVAETEQLLDWVEAGGDLIATPQRALLDVFGVEVDEGHEGDERNAGDIEVAHGEEDDGGEAGDDGGGGDSEAAGNVLAVDPGDGRAYRVEVALGARLIDALGAAEYGSGPGDRHVVLRHRHGEGTVTFLADDWPLLNPTIGDHEHASFLWALLSAEGRPAAVRVVWRIPRASLLAVLRERASPALASGLVLLGAWAWRRSRRFGPLLPDPPPSRRSLLEHVRASGDFLYRHGRADALVEAARRAVQRAAAAGHAGWSRLPAEEVRARLARTSGLADEVAAAALEGPPPAEPAAFTRMIQTLDRMRKAR